MIEPRASATWTWHPHAAWTAGAAAALGCVVAARVEPGLLRAGGLAPLLISAGVAVLLGAPLASALWGTETSAEGIGPAQAARRALAACWGVLVVGAAAAEGLGPLGAWATPVALGGWGAAWAISGRGHRSIALTALAATAVVLLAGAVQLAGASPWTLLEPRWDAWPRWSAGAVTSGLLLAATGFGVWARQAREPGLSTLPWASAGAALGVALLASVGAAAAFEAVPPDGPTASAAIAASTGLLVVAAGASSLSAAERRRPAALGGAAATVWWLWPAADALGLWWDFALPAGLAVLLGLTGWLHRGTTRAIAAAAGLLAAGSAVASWPGLPESALSAAAGAAIVVAVFWVVASAAQEAA